MINQGKTHPHQPDKKRSGWLTRVALAIGSLCLPIVSTMSPAHAAQPPHPRTLTPTLLPKSSTPESADESTDFIRTSMSCPSEVGLLSDVMLRDVADYGNRVSQRSRRSVQDIAPQSHIISASHADIESLEPTRYNTIPPIEDIRAQGLESIFFTTLERQYLQNESVLLQHYHWAFLAKTTEGWGLAFMYSTLGDYPATDPPTPPRDSNHGVIAQAIRVWLRDCQAGSIEAPGT